MVRALEKILVPKWSLRTRGRTPYLFQYMAKAETTKGINSELSARKILKGVFILFGSGLFILSVLFIAALYPLSQGMSEIADRVDVTSPDGRYVASGYHVWGGATVSDSTIVEMRPNGWLVPKAEYVLSVDMTKPGNNPFSISWMNGNHLDVKYTAGTICKKSNQWKDVTISFVEQ